MALGLGPLDAQCCLLELMLGKTWTEVEPAQALQLMESVAVLALKETSTQERVVGRNCTDLSKGAARLLDYQRMSKYVLNLQCAVIFMLTKYFN